MSILFADIYEAIQNLRIQKGVSEKDILNYIEERVGGCLKASNFMKTIRTLQKMVDDGVLLKKGKRFAFSSDDEDKHSPGQNDEDDEDEKEENEGETELDMSDDECDEGEENECEGGGDEDDDDDDDDDDEDDDDDDDDDDDEGGNECDEKENTKKETSSKGDQNPAEKRSANKDRMIMSPKKANENSSNKSGNAFNSGVNCDSSKENNEASSRRILSGDTRSIIEQNDDIRNTETIAFCVRDFIDSLYRPKTDCKSHEKANIPEILLQESTDATEIEEIGRGKLSANKKRKLRKKRDQSRCNYRSRSPIKIAKAEIFHSLKRDRSDEVCFWVASNQFLPEPMDADMDVDLEKDIGVAAEYDECRHRSPVGPPPDNSPNVHVNRKESFCSNQDNKTSTPCFEESNEHFLQKNVQNKPSQMDNNANNQSNWYCSEEKAREQDNVKRSFSVEDETSASVERQTSLCSFCDKNEINT